MRCHGAEVNRHVCSALFKLNYGELQIFFRVGYALMCLGFIRLRYGDSVQCRPNSICSHTWKMVVSSESMCFT